MLVRLGNFIYRRADSPKMFIMRGVSGSGKSTTAEELAEEESIFSTDEFFTDDDGEYNFDMDKIEEAHQWNKDRVTDAIKEGVNPIVVDNTTVQAWEAKPYVEMALDAGYEIEIVEPDSPWWENFEPDLDEDELINLAETLSEKNTHGVTEEIILKMFNKWEHDITVDDILSSETPSK